MPSPPPTVTVGAKAAAHVAEYAVAEAPKSTLEPHWATQRSLRHLIRRCQPSNQPFSSAIDIWFAVSSCALPRGKALSPNQQLLLSYARGGSALDEGVSTLRNDFRYAMGQDYLPHHYGAYESNSVRRQGEDAPTMTAILRGVH